MSTHCACRRPLHVFRTASASLPVVTACEWCDTGRKDTGEVDGTVLHVRAVPPRLA